MRCDRTHLRRRVLLGAALAAVLASAPPGAAAQDQVPPATLGPPEPSGPAAPTPDASAGAERRGPTIRPHLSVGFVAAGGGGVSFEGGVRVHPAVLTYSAWALSGQGDEYVTFSGVRFGYQRGLSRQWSAYATLGVGAAQFHGADDVTRSGGMTLLGAGILLGNERSMNLLSIGVEVLFPSAPSDLPRGSRLGDTQVALALTVNPIALLAWKVMTVH